MGEDVNEVVTWMHQFSSWSSTRTTNVRGVALVKARPETMLLGTACATVGSRGWLLAKCVFTANKKGIAGRDNRNSVERNVQVWLLVLLGLVAL